jgi:hypothetical protein
LFKADFLLLDYSKQPDSMKNYFYIFVFILANILCSGQVYSADSKPANLGKEINAKVMALSKEGDELVRASKYREATTKYITALELLPEPITQWEACTLILTSIGNANFLSKNFEQAKLALSDAMHCPKAIGNPFIHLRLGQSQLELGNKPRAGDELARAYMGGGKEIFANENSKYFEFLKTVLKPPANGKW